MDIKVFTSAISQIAEEKGISAEKIIDTIELAIAAAYKKEYGLKGQKIKAKIDPKTGNVKFWQVKLVIDSSMIYSEEELEALKDEIASRADKAIENDKIKPSSAKITENLSYQSGTSADEEEKEKKFRFNPEKHIMIEDAKKEDSKIKIEEELEIPLETKEEYGRIAAQTAKQVIMQRIREAERETIYEEYKSKEGEIISGVVQRIEAGTVFLDIGKTLGVLSKEEQVRGEFYQPGQRLKVYVVKIEEGSRGPAIFLSRAYPKIISKLFELEVPEVANGTVVIKSIAREAGSRSKVAVTSDVEGVDPVGSMVGQRGTRVGAVILELGGEKVDIIEWSEDPEEYIANSLAPAKIIEVRIEPKNKAVAIIPEDQLSLAIGKDGQNVRLSAKLTGWKIDIRSAERIEEEEEKKKKAKAEKKEKKSPTKVVDKEKTTKKLKTAKKPKTAKTAKKPKKPKTGKADKKVAVKKSK